MPTKTTTAQNRLPHFVKPMKALAVTKVPAGDWLLEIKFDGYRALALLKGRSVELCSRNENSFSADYPAVVAALKKLPCRNALLDGEIVALDPQGRSHFQLLQRRKLTGSNAPIFYYVFDLLHLDGVPYLNQPIEERKAALDRLLKHPPEPVRASPVFDCSPEKLLAEAKRRGLEGIVAKSRGSIYEPDRRSGAWVKCRVTREQEFVIGGYTPPGGSRSYFGALLVGYYREGKLYYAGKVGTGFDQCRLESLHRKFSKLRTSKCPFINLPLSSRTQNMPPSEMRTVAWLRPKLVAQIRFSEWTGEGLLRQPVFLGLRNDKEARDVVREALAR